jgi:hypothetical protein
VDDLARLSGATDLGRAEPFKDGHHPALSPAPPRLDRLPSSRIELRRGSIWSRTGHELRYPNVIVAHWPKPGAGKHVRAWHCLACKATIYDHE